MSSLLTFSGRRISPEAVHVLRETHAARDMSLSLAVANLSPCEYTVNYWCDACGYTHHQEAGPYPDPDEVCPKCGEPLEWEVL